MRSLSRSSNSSPSTNRPLQRCPSSRRSTTSSTTLPTHPPIPLTSSPRSIWRLTCPAPSNCKAKKSARQLALSSSIPPLIMRVPQWTIKSTISRLKTVILPQNPSFQTKTTAKSMKVMSLFALLALISSEAMCLGRWSNTHLFDTRARTQTLSNPAKHWQTDCLFD